MGKIRILDTDVVGQIAAGEVVDRPATIVKELVENALDAGASRIEIALEGGGIEEIRVSDDGSGMEEGDAALALQRHATSKIVSIADLEKIGTYGFRGEALASIAAVSKLELLTRSKHALEGVKIQVEAGEIKAIAPAGSPAGTRLVVRNLFHNIPARRKFLKSAQTEEAASFDLLGKIALGRTDVAFQAKKGDKVLYTLSAGESLNERYQKLFPQTQGSQLFAFESSRHFMRLTGILGGPNFPKTSRKAVFFYVNKRVVRAGVLSQAVIDGYSGYLQPGKFPIALLFLEIDGKWVDVNVHPTKAEVRLSNPREVYAFVEQSVATRLRELQEDIRPRVAASVPMRGRPSYGDADPVGRPFWAVPDPLTGSAPKLRFEENTLFEKLAPYTVERKSGERSLFSPESATLLTSIAKTYALFQEGQTLFMVDLHVAHERINYDLLESRLGSNALPAQQFLTPVVLPLSLPQRALMSKYGDFLAKMGFHFEEFGGDNVLLRSAPMGFEKIGEKKLLLSFIDKLEKIDEVKGPEDTDRKILATLACRASIQSGDDVSTLEMKSIFEKVLKSSNPYFCPHGRPILVKLTLEEVHRLFKRTWS